MKPENFKHCDRNCLPIKIFRDMLLQGGVSFDVQSLFVGTENAWLASMLLNTENMTSLNNLPDLKRQMLMFVETEIVPALILSVK